MTLHQLAVQARDVSAAGLGLLLGAAAPRALAERRLVDADGGVLVLGVLAASHVITATRPGARLVEQVSCDAVAGGGQRLPDRLEDGAYQLTASTTVLPRSDLDALAEHLRAQARTSPAWLCGAFPGDDAALTALTGHALHGGGWGWQTWHLYPQSDDGAVVETCSRWQP